MWSLVIFKPHLKVWSLLTFKPQLQKSVVFDKF